MSRNRVVLVDEFDHVLGEEDKLRAHQKGELHRAFSIFIFNDKNELLLQQRALDKYHGGGLWTNTCCSHPQFGENVKDSAIERLYYEMGLVCDIDFSHAFVYKATVENDLIEYEYDHVFIGYSNDKPVVNKSEVSDYKWVPIKDILVDIKQNPHNYTYWFKEAFPEVIQKLNS